MYPHHLTAPYVALRRPTSNQPWGHQINYVKRSGVTNVKRLSGFAVLAYKSCKVRAHIQFKCGADIIYRLIISQIFFK